MGGSKSKEKDPKLEKDNPNGVSPQFDKEWRDTPWGEKERLENDLRTFQLCSSDVKHVRILLVGQIGAGKSSFINSSISLFQGRITTDALTNSASNFNRSFTKAYRSYDIRSGDSVLPFVFTDTMGLESQRSHGIDPDDIIKAIQGCIKEEYTFNPMSPVSEDDKGHRSNPSINERHLCLVYIMAADNITLINPEIIEKFTYIRQKASDMNIPQAIIMTRVDEACPLVKGDLRKIYFSKKIKEKMILCSDIVGVPVSHIYPVKNYHEESDTNNDVDVLILRALTHIVHIANDKLIRLNVKS